MKLKYRFPRGTRIPAKLGSALNSTTVSRLLLHEPGQTRNSLAGLKIFTDAAISKRPVSPVAVGDPELLDEAFSDVDFESLFDEPTATDVQPWI